MLRFCQSVGNFNGKSAGRCVDRHPIDMVIYKWEEIILYYLWERNNGFAYQIRYLRFFDPAAQVVSKAISFLLNERLCEICIVQIGFVSVVLSSYVLIKHEHNCVVTVIRLDELTSHSKNLLDHSAKLVSACQGFSVLL